MLKKVLFISVFLVLVSFITACEKPIEDVESTDTNIYIQQNIQCYIVYGSDAGNGVVKSANDLADVITTCTGATVTVCSDWQRSEGTKSRERSENSVEILFGLTSRAESIALYERLPENGYIVSTKKNTILIGASSEKILSDASDAFINEYVKQREDFVITCPKEKDIINDSYSFFVIADGAKSDISIVIPQNSPKIEYLANIYSELVYQKCGAEIPVLRKSNIDPAQNFTNKIIISLNDPDADEPTSKGTVKCSGGNIYISGNSTEDLLNTFYKFISLTVIDCDRRESGSCYVVYPEEQEITCNWNYSFPMFPCGTLISIDNPIDNYYTIEFDDVKPEGYKIYVAYLTRLGYLVQSSHVEADYEEITYSDGKTTIRSVYSPKTSDIKLYVTEKD